MILEFTSINKDLWDGFNDFLRKKIKEKSAVSQSFANRTLIQEGTDYSFIVPTGKQTMDFQRASKNFNITREELPSLSLSEIFKRLEILADEMAGQMERGLFKAIHQAGNMNSEENGMPLTPETILEHLGKIDIGFHNDDINTPHILSLVVAPGMDKVLEQQLSEMSEKDRNKLEQRRKQLYAKKYEEYTAREQRRKLVD